MNADQALKQDEEASVRVDAVRKSSSYPNPHAPLAILKPADYVVHIVSSNSWRSESGIESGFSFELELLTDGLQGCRLHHEIYLSHHLCNKTTQKGQAAYSALKSAVGVHSQVTNLSMLHGKPFTVRVETVGGVHRGSDHGPLMNIITGFNPRPKSRTRYSPATAAGVR